MSPICQRDTHLAYPFNAFKLQGPYLVSDHPFVDFGWQSLAWQMAIPDMSLTYARYKQTFPYSTHTKTCTHFQLQRMGPACHTARRIARHTDKHTDLCKVYHVRKPSWSTSDYISVWVHPCAVAVLCFCKTLHRVVWVSLRSWPLGPVAGYNSVGATRRRDRTAVVSP